MSAARAPKPPVSRQERGRPRLGRASLALALALAAGFASPRAALADDDVAPPVRYPPSSIRGKLIAGGVVVFGLGYAGGAIGASSAPEWPGSDELYIPVVGPFMSLGRLGCPAREPACDGGFLALRAILIGVEAAMQLGGLALVGEGIFLKTEAPSAAPAKKGLAAAEPVGGKEGAKKPAKKTSAFVLPVPVVGTSPVGGGYAGLGLVGTF